MKYPYVYVYIYVCIRQCIKYRPSKIYIVVSAWNLYDKLWCVMNTYGCFKLSILYYFQLKCVILSVSVHFRRHFFSHYEKRGRCPSATNLLVDRFIFGRFRPRTPRRLLCFYRSTENGASSGPASALFQICQVVPG